MIDTKNSPRRGARACAALALLWTTGTLLAYGGSAQAAATRALTARDFLGYQAPNTYFETDNAEAVIAGDAYNRDVHIQTCGQTVGVSFNALRFPGYRALSFDLGIADRTNVNSFVVFTVTADGRPLYRKELQQGQIATHVSLPFGRFSVFSLSARQTSGVCSHVLLGNPTVTPSGGGPVAASSTGTLPLTERAFYGYQAGYTAFGYGNVAATIAGHTYARAITIKTCNMVAGVSFNARRFPGYRALSFDLGIADRTNVNSLAIFTVTADGRPLYRRELQQGQIAIHVSLPFGRFNVFSLSAQQTSGVCTDVIVGDPMALR